MTNRGGALEFPLSDTIVVPVPYALLADEAAWTEASALEARLAERIRNAERYVSADERYMVGVYLPAVRAFLQAESAAHADRARARHPFADLLALALMIGITTRTPADEPHLFYENLTLYGYLSRLGIFFKTGIVETQILLYTRRRMSRKAWRQTQVRALLATVFVENVTANLVEALRELMQLALAYWAVFTPGGAIGAASATAQGGRVVTSLPFTLEAEAQKALGGGFGLFDLYRVSVETEEKVNAEEMTAQGSDFVAILFSALAVIPTLLVFALMLAVQTVMGIYNAFQYLLAALDGLELYGELVEILEGYQGVILGDEVRVDVKGDIFARYPLTAPPPTNLPQPERELRRPNPENLQGDPYTPIRLRAALLNTRMEQRESGRIFQLEVIEGGEFAPRFSDPNLFPQPSPGGRYDPYTLFAEEKPLVWTYVELIDNAPSPAETRFVHDPGAVETAYQRVFEFCELPIGDPEAPPDPSGKVATLQGDLVRVAVAITAEELSVIQDPATGQITGTWQQVKAHFSAQGLRVAYRSLRMYVLDYNKRLSVTGTLTHFSKTLSTTVRHVRYLAVHLGIDLPAGASFGLLVEDAYHEKVRVGPEPARTTTTPGGETQRVLTVELPETDAIQVALQGVFREANAPDSLEFVPPDAVVEAVQPGGAVSTRLAAALPRVRQMAGETRGQLAKVMERLRRRSKG